jgi:serine/threonine protein kinase/Tfp pilus assembly protein PilF
MTTPPEPSEDEIRTSLEAELSRDIARGGKAPLSVYLARHPDQVDLVADTWAATKAGPGPSPKLHTLERLGSYELEDEIGRGGQGVVYRAIDERLRRVVALKVLTGLGPDAQQQIARFRREAEVASKLDHPGICGVYETGIEDGVPFIAMRFVEGESLAERIRHAHFDESKELETFVSFGRSAPSATRATDTDTNTGASKDEGDSPSTLTRTATSSSRLMSRADLEATITLFEKIARALHAAHESGIVHRDIKPANIMLTAEGDPVILDFGLARDHSDESAAALTQTGDHFGTPAYMSPEQISGSCDQLDRRSDVFSLGVALFECLTLERPFRGPTREALYQSITTDSPPDPRRLNRRIPLDLKAVIECALEKNRDRRYATAADFADDLASVRAHRPIAARRISLAGRLWRWSRRHPMRATLGLVLALGLPLVAGLGGYIFANLDDIRAQEEARTAEAVEEALESAFRSLSLAEVDDAQAHFEAALADAPNSFEANAGLALTLVRRGKAKEALARLDEAQERFERPEILDSTRAEILSSLGRHEESAAVLEGAPAPSTGVEWFIEGLRLFERAERPGAGRAEAREFMRGAEAMTTRAVIASPPRRAYHYQLAAVVGRLGKKARSHAVADTLQALWPDSDEAMFSAGFALQDYAPAQAEKAYRRALELSPRAISHGNLGIVLARQGKHEEAIASYRRALELEPTAIIHHDLSNTLRRLKRFEEAVAESRAALALDASQPEIHAGLAQALSSLGRDDEAVAVYQKAIEIRPGYAAAHTNLGTIYAAQGKVDEAIACYRESLRHEPELAMTHFVLSNALRTKKDLEGAAESLRQTLRLAPDFASAANNLGSLLSQLGRVDDAILHYQDAIKRFPDQPKMHYNLADLLGRRGRKEEAIASFREAIRIDPNYALAYCSLGQRLSDDGQQEEAYAMLQRGHELGTKAGNWRYPSDKWTAGVGLRLAKVLEERGEIPRAVEVIEEVIALLPKMPVIENELKRLRAKL